MAQANKVSKKRITLALVLVSVLAVAFIASFYLQVISKAESLAPKRPAGFFFGVTAGGTVKETKTVIDKIKGYTNLIVFTNPAVTENLNSLEEVADYASEKGLSFYVQTTYPSPYSDLNFNPLSWISSAKVKYGDKFMGYYLYDEPGGNQVDQGDYVQFDQDSKPSDYRDATNTYVYYLYIQLRDFEETNVVTSDYALYWFDYEAGYDTVFCEFGWNSSRALNIAQCRGAAEMHNKTWGAILTWTYTEPPYMESPQDLFQDMVTAYDAGAKYVLVFNYPQENQYGVLSEQHFEEMKAFWQYAGQTPQNGSSNKEKVAYVIPDNYGFGFRGITEKIWGLWDPDELTPLIWNEANALVETYGYNFDIIVGSPYGQVFGRVHYDKLIRWNSTDTR